MMDTTAGYIPRCRTSVSSRPAVLYKVERTVLACSENSWSQRSNEISEITFGKVSVTLNMNLYIAVRILSDGCCMCSQQQQPQKEKGELKLRQIFEKNDLMSVFENILGFFDPGVATVEKNLDQP